MSEKLMLAHPRLIQTANANPLASNATINSLLTIIN